MFLRSNKPHFFFSSLHPHKTIADFQFLNPPPPLAAIFLKAWWQPQPSYDLELLSNSLFPVSNNIYHRVYLRRGCFPELRRGGCRQNCSDCEVAKSASKQILWNRNDAAGRRNNAGAGVGVCARYSWFEDLELLRIPLFNTIDSCDERCRTESWNHWNLRNVLR